MKLTINAVFDVGDFNVVIDDRGRFWRLPFVDSRNHKRKVKELRVFYHKGMNAVRINNVIYNERDLHAQRRVNKRVLKFDI